MQIKIILKSFVLILILTCFAAASTPDWSVNPANFEMSANMTAVLYLDKNIVTGEENLVGVFIEDSCRGVASPIYTMNTWMYFITIYSNTNNEIMHLQAYIADKDTVLDVDETIVFESNSTYGSPGAPFELNTFLDYDFPPSVNGIPDQILEEGESFNPVILKDYLEQLDNDPVTWINSGNNYLGVSISADNIAAITPPYPEWTGTDSIIFTAIEQTAQGLSDSDTAVFTILSADNPPVILDIPDQTIGLSGKFEIINLNDYLEEQDGDSVIWDYSFETESASEPPPDWSVQPSDYEMSMTITAELMVRGKPALSGSHILGAFAVEPDTPDSLWECRGLAAPVNVMDSWLYFLTIYSNINEQQICPRFFDDTIDNILPVREQFSFSSNEAYGSPADPVILNSGYLIINITAGNLAQIDIVDSLWSGNETVQFRVSDYGTLHEYSDSTAVTFTILPDYQPVVSNIQDQTIEQGGTFNVFDLDDYLKEMDGDPIIWSVQGNENLNVSINNNNETTISPINSEWAGSEAIIFTATDNTSIGLSDADTAQFIIILPDHPPAITGIPDQEIGVFGEFSPINLNNYLTELDGDSVIWDYTFPASAEPTERPGWTVQPADYERSMTVTAIVSSHGDTISYGNHLLGAFSGEECRGTATPLNIMDKWLYFLTIYSNAEGENITLKFYEESLQEIFPVKPAFTFSSNATYGEPVNPFFLIAGFLDININDSNIASIDILDNDWIDTEEVQFIVTDWGTLHEFTDSQTVNLTISKNDHHPIVNGIPDQTIRQGEQFSSITLNNYLTEFDGDSVTWSACGNSNLIVEITANSYAHISTSDDNWLGTEAIIFTATDFTETKLSGADTVLFTVQEIVPIELASFNATIERNGVKLQWVTATESNNYGFFIQRKFGSTDDWQGIGFREGKGTTTVPQVYSYLDAQVSPGKWYYRLQQQDIDGQASYSQEIEINIAAPKKFVLTQNYPNPFNSSTTINYELPTGEHRVKLIIYDILGHRIKTLVDLNKQSADFYQVNWDGTDESGKTVSSGVYFYQLHTGQRKIVRKMVLIE